MLNADQLDRLWNKLLLAKRQGEFLGASEVALVLEIIRLLRKLTRGSGYFGPAEGPIPTIGSMRASGVNGLRIDCRNVGCGNSRKLTFADLRLPDAIVFLEIPRHRGFRCTKCDGREVYVTADWPSHGHLSHGAHTATDRPFPKVEGPQK